MKVWVLISDIGNEREVRTFDSLSLAQLAMQFHVDDLVNELGLDDDPHCIGEMWAELEVAGEYWECEIYETEVES